VVGPACGGDPAIRRTVLEMAGEGLRVIAVARRDLTPEQVAALALFLCREEAASITGANISMDGGWTAA
jgi:NAD(P)-dependent dehydrogenase (short-subunit alcohol dehydrogenase family)